MKLKMKNRLSAETYIEGILKGDRMLLSRAITLVESALPSDQQLADKVMAGVLPHSGNSIRVGITGVPGVGKSTFIESFGKILVEKGFKLAVLAIDPTSKQSHGSILGDKTRMESLAGDKRAFIRPSPAGNILGGVSSRTRETMLLCEAAGFNIVLVETVGVGQSETLVKGMVDFFLLLMLAGAGDELQGIKKGIIEICDGMVINKADGENIEIAKRAMREYANALHLFPMRENSWLPQVKICSSIDQTGLHEIWEMIERYQMTMKSNGYFDSNRAEQRVNWMYEHIRFLLENSFYQHPAIKEKLLNNITEVRSGKVSPITIARELIHEFINKQKKYNE